MKRKVDSPDTPSLAWLTAGLAVAALPLVAFLPPWVPVLFVLLAIWRLWIEKQVAALPHLRWRLLLFMVVCGGVFLSFGTLLRTSAALALLIGLLGLKLLELKGQRDFVLTTFVGFFVMLTAFFYSQSLLVSFWELLAAPLLLAGLIRSQAGRGSALPAKDCLLRAFGMMGLALPVLIVLFLFFPRVQGRFGSGIGQNDIGVTGMSDVLRPGSFSQMTNSTEPAFRVDFPDGGIPAEPARYWRGPVLNRCMGLEWRRGDMPFSYTRLPDLRDNGLRQIVTLEPHRQLWLFALDRPIWWVRGASFNRGQTLLAHQPVTRLLRYEVFSAMEDLDPNVVRSRLVDALEVETPVSKEVVALAESFRDPEGVSVTVRKGLQYFSSNPFAYSTAPGIYVAGASGLDEFLFRRRQGFCEHYAAAFATLMRLAGVPARVVLGYQGGSLNRSGNYITVRQSDAHAWTEVWLGEADGWTRVDPTQMVAPERLEFGMTRYAELSNSDISSEEMRERLMSGGEAFSLGQWRIAWLDLWDHANFQWNLLVVGYDYASQTEMVRSLGLGERLRSFQGLFLLSGAGFLVAVGVMALLIWRPRRNGDPLSRETERWVTLLSRHSGPRLAAEGFGAYVARSLPLIPHWKRDLLHAAEIYQELRYAKPAEDSREHTRRAVDELKSMRRRLRFRKNIESD